MSNSSFCLHVFIRKSTYEALLDSGLYYHSMKKFPQNVDIYIIIIIFFFFFFLGGGRGREVTLLVPGENRFLQTT